MTDTPLAGVADADSMDPTSPKNSRTTPRHIFDGLNERHHFTLDAAASHENALVENYCTVNGFWKKTSMNGAPYYHPALPPDGELRRFGPDGIAIAQIWLPEDGTVFCNPPHGRGLIEPFIKAWALAAVDRGVTSVFLVPVKAEQPWWHDWVWSNSMSRPYVWVTELEFPRGRLKYGGMSTAAPFPSVIITFGGTGAV